MHLTNWRWWIYCSGRWAEHFNGCRVVEFGSRNINGTVRPLFVDCNYTGVDAENGKCVDAVCSAADFDWGAADGLAQTVISASMLEHDPAWRDSLTNMISGLTPDGALFLSWGAAGNPPHKPGPHAPVLAGELLQHLRSLALNIQEFRYERGMPFNQDYVIHDRLMPGGPGARRGGRRGRLVDCASACVVAFPDPGKLSEPRFIDDLRKGDR